MSGHACVLSAWFTAQIVLIVGQNSYYDNGYGGLPNVNFPSPQNPSYQSNPFQEQTANPPSHHNSKKIKFSETLPFSYSEKISAYPIDDPNQYNRNPYYSSPSDQMENPNQFPQQIQKYPSYQSNPFQDKTTNTPSPNNSKKSKSSKSSETLPLSYSGSISSYPIDNPKKYNRNPYYSSPSDQMLNPYQFPSLIPRNPWYQTNPNQGQTANPPSPLNSKKNKSSDTLPFSYPKKLSAYPMDNAKQYHGNPYYSSPSAQIASPYQSSPYQDGTYEYLKNIPYLQQSQLYIPSQIGFIPTQRPIKNRIQNIRREKYRNYNGEPSKEVDDSSQVGSWSVELVPAWLYEQFNDVFSTINAIVRSIISVVRWILPI